MIGIKAIYQRQTFNSGEQTIYHLENNDLLKTTWSLDHGFINQELIDDFNTNNFNKKNFNEFNLSQSRKEHINSVYQKLI